jgi:hypothetical protein
MTISQGTTANRDAGHMKDILRPYRIAQAGGADGREKKTKTIGPRMNADEHE